MNKLFRIKSASGQSTVALKEVCATRVEFSPGENASHAVTIILRGGVEVDVEMTTAELEAFQKEWNAAL